jgi:hypothetical protein
MATSINAAVPSPSDTPYGGTLKGIFTVLPWAVPLIGILCGGLLGASISFAPVQAALVEIDQNCTLYTAASTCEGSSHCLWRPSSIKERPPCVFVDGVDCSALRTADLCNAAGPHGDHCMWLPSSSWCAHQAGYSALHVMLLYSTLLFGAALGSLIAYPLLQSYGLRRAFLISGYIAVIACAGVHASTITDTPFILMSARGVLGVACGIASCAGPLFIAKRSPASYQRIGGVLFHLGTTFAAVICGFVGLVVAPRSYDNPNGMQMEARKEALAAVPLMYAIGLVIAGHLIPKSPLEGGDDQQAGNFAHEIDDPYPEHVDDAIFFATTAFIAVEERFVSSGSGGAYGSLTSPISTQRSPMGPAAFARQLSPSPPRYLFDHARPVLMALLFAASDQLTGFGAVMFVAPTITTTSVDTSPLTGNFFLQVWCFAASTVSLLLVLRATMRNLFSVGLAFVSVGCGVVAASSWRGMLADDDSRRAAIGLGISLFIGGYEMGVGSNFYPLSIAAQPGTIRTISTSFTMALRFLLHTTVVVMFPIVATNVFPTTTSKDLVSSGGGDGSEGDMARLGLSAAFAFLGAVAAVCGVVVFKALPRFNA